MNRLRAIAIALVMLFMLPSAVHAQDCSCGSAAKWQIVLYDKSTGGVERYERLCERCYQTKYRCEQCGKSLITKSNKYDPCPRGGKNYCWQCYYVCQRCGKANDGHNLDDFREVPGEPSPVCRACVKAKKAQAAKETSEFFSSLASATGSSLARNAVRLVLLTLAVAAVAAIALLLRKRPG